MQGNQQQPMQPQVQPAQMQGQPQSQPQQQPYNLQKAMFSTPIPGQSLTQPKGAAPYEKPPQFVDMNDAMNFLMTQITDPVHGRQILHLLDTGISIEEMTRVILFTGFAIGKWTVDLMMLLYKPLMLALIAFAHRANLHHVNVIQPKKMVARNMNRLNQHNMMYVMKEARDAANDILENKQEEAVQNPVVQNIGFMERG